WLGGTRAVAWHLKRVCGPVTLLDVASGAADIPLSLSRRFPDIRAVAFDLSGTMLSLAQGLPRVRGDVRRLPFRDRSVDYVISTHFFHHLADEQIVLTLREFDRIG